MSIIHPLAALTDPSQPLSRTEVAGLIREGHDVASLSAYRAKKIREASNQSYEGTAA